MIGPLVEHLQIAVEFLGLNMTAYGILTDEGSAHVGNQAVDTVVDLGVDVIGTSCQYNDRLMLFACLGDDFLSFSLYLCFIVIKGSEGSINSLADFLLGDIRVGLGKHFLQFFDQLLFMEQAKIIIEEMYLRLIQITDIGVQHFGIIGYNRAIIAVFRALFIYIVGHAGIEDIGDSLLQEPFDMAVHQLGRIADGVAGDGSLTKTVNSFVFNRTVYNLEAQAGE